MVLGQYHPGEKFVVGGGGGGWWWWWCSGILVMNHEMEKKKFFFFVNCINYTVGLGHAFRQVEEMIASSILGVRGRAGAR